MSLLDALAAPPVPPRQLRTGPALRPMRTAYGSALDPASTAASRPKERRRLPLPPGRWTDVKTPTGESRPSGGDWLRAAGGKLLKCEEMHRHLGTAQLGGEATRLGRRATLTAAPSGSAAMTAAETASRAPPTVSAATEFEGGRLRLGASDQARGVSSWRACGSAAARGRGGGVPLRRPPLPSPALPPARRQFCRHLAIRRTRCGPRPTAALRLLEPPRSGLGIEPPCYGG